MITRLQTSPNHNDSVQNFTPRLNNIQLNLKQARQLRHEKTEQLKYMNSRIHHISLSLHGSQKTFIDLGQRVRKIQEVNNRLDSTRSLKVMSQQNLRELLKQKQEEIKEYRITVKAQRENRAKLNQVKLQLASDYFKTQREINHDGIEAIQNQQQSRRIDLIKQVKESQQIGEENKKKFFSNKRLQLQKYQLKKFSETRLKTQDYLQKIIELEKNENDLLQNVRKSQIFFQEAVKEMNEFVSYDADNLLEFIETENKQVETQTQTLAEDIQSPMKGSRSSILYNFIRFPMTKEGVRIHGNKYDKRF